MIETQIIKSDDKPIMVVLDYQEYKRLKELEQDYLDYQEIQNIKKKAPEFVPFEKVKKDLGISK